MNKAYEYLMNNGMMSAEDYPYEENDEETQCRYQEDKAVMKVKSWGFSGTQDEEEIKALLIEMQEEYLILGLISYVLPLLTMLLPL